MHVCMKVEFNFKNSTIGIAHARYADREGKKSVFINSKISPCHIRQSPANNTG